MNLTPIIASTLLLTLFSLIGLVFFIRASVKDRVTLLQCPIDPEQSDRLSALKQYLNQRAYQVILVSTETQEMQLQGQVRPSLFLAIFLTALAALGLLCSALVLGVLIPDLSQISLFSILLCPLAGLYYWQKAGRLEQIYVGIKAASPSAEELLLTIRGHRDELRQLRENFAWPWLDQNSH